MVKHNEAKAALDSVIKKSRVHFYKPIQIAEILYRHRTEKGLDISDLESYRSVSKKWRDIVSDNLIGRSSTSSAKYQDNIFEENAMPPRFLEILADFNKRNDGLVEAYIYKSLQARLGSVNEVWKYIKSSTADTFSIKKLVGFFTTIPGLKRSVDKVYEITVYALFSTLVRSLKAQVTLEIANKDEGILHDFERFIKTVLGIDAKQTKLVVPAALYRVGVTNAADRGLDIWANFGPAIQVKHLSLTQETIEGITGGISADRIVIVCLSAERGIIETILKQVGFAERIQGIITLEDLDAWYQLCLSKKYRDKLGINLLKDLQREFEAEFPSLEGIVPFLKTRSYDKIALVKGWEII